MSGGAHTLRLRISDASAPTVAAVDQPIAAVSVRVESLEGAVLLQGVTSGGDSAERASEGSEEVPVQWAAGSAEALSEQPQQVVLVMQVRSGVTLFSFGFE